jgi:hypothetical protein
VGFYRLESGGVGIYEAVDSDCPREDLRRAGKPDGSWLPRVGAKFPGAISLWTEQGLRKYHVSGLLKWHASVVRAQVEVLVVDQIEQSFHCDEWQVICDVGVRRKCRRVPLQEFLKFPLPVE